MTALGEFDLLDSHLCCRSREVNNAFLSPIVYPKSFRFEVDQGVGVQLTAVSQLREQIEGSLAWYVATSGPRGTDVSAWVWVMKQHIIAVVVWYCNVDRWH